MTGAPQRRTLLSDQRGVGLTEMLVVAGMLTVLLVSLFGTVLAARTFKQRSERLGESLQVMRFAATRFAEDIRHLSPASWGCPDPTTISFRDSNGRTILEYYLEQVSGTEVALRRRKDVNLDGAIDPATEEELVATGLWGDAGGALGTYFDCWFTQKQVMLWMTVLDPTREVDPGNPPDEALYTVPVRAAIRT